MFNISVNFAGTKTDPIFDSFMTNGLYCHTLFVIYQLLEIKDEL